jgi:hypothetical protein
MNGYQACALSLGLNLLVGTGMILWNRFGSKKKSGVGEVFFRMQIVVLTMMAVVDDFFRILWVVVFATSLLGWGVHWVIKRKSPDYQSAKGWGVGRRLVCIVGQVTLLGSIWILGSALFNHGSIWIWEILDGINDISKTE